MSVDERPVACGTSLMTGSDREDTKVVTDYKVWSTDLVAHIEIWVIPNAVPVPNAMLHDSYQQPGIIHSCPSHSGPVDRLGSGHHPISLTSLS